MAPADASPGLRRLLKRSEFVRAARGRRAGRPGFSLQAVASEVEVPGVGLTVTKKVGNAPERNRIKRRLRAAVRSCAAGFRSRHDYVLVGRRDALSLPFATLVGDLEHLLRRVHDTRPSRPDPIQPEGSGITE